MVQSLWVEADIRYEDASRDGSGQRFRDDGPRENDQSLTAESVLDWHEIRLDAKCTVCP